MSSIPERVSRLESMVDHMATAADIAQLETKMVKWILSVSYTLLAGTGILVSTIFLVLRLTD